MMTENIYRSAFSLFRDYFFRSEDRYYALGLLALSLISIVFIVGCTFGLQIWFGGFWTILTSGTTAAFINSLWQFAALTTGLTILTSIKDYLRETLTIRWRNYLTKQFIEKLIPAKENNQTENRGYLNLSRFKELIEQPSQRIQEDIRIVSENLVWMVADLFFSALRLVFFASMLWIVGGSISFLLFGASITIPGYLVWIAIGFSLTGALLKKALGSNLSTVNIQQKACEAAFRQEIDDLLDKAENISQENGQNFYKGTINDKTTQMLDKAYDKRQIKTRFSAFDTAYVNLMFLFPYLITAPLYFLNKIGMGQLMQAGMAFTEVSGALNWFADSYEYISDFNSSRERLYQLRVFLDRTNPGDVDQKISIQKEKADNIRVKNLTLIAPKKKDNSIAIIIKNLNLQFKKGENTVIEGRSGLGKSTLLKAISKSWAYGDGTIILPKGEKVLILSQKTTIPPNLSLKELLSYPKSVANADYKNVLTAVKLEKYLDDLDKKDNWASRLSGGELQRISFARALLVKPDWLLLDETTASLDVGLENEMYMLLKEKMPQTTLISIAHKKTVAQYHSRVLMFKRNPQSGDTEIEEKWPQANC